MCFCLNLSFLIHKMVKWDCLCKLLKKAAGTEQPCTSVVKHRWQGGFLEFQHQLVIWALWLWASYCTGHWGWRGLQWWRRSSQAKLCLMGRAIIKAADYEAFTSCTVLVLTSELSSLSWGMSPHSDNCVSAWVCLVFLFSTNSKPKKTMSRILRQGNSGEPKILQHAPCCSQAQEPLSVIISASKFLHASSLTLCKSLFLAKIAGKENNAEGGFLPFAQALSLLLERTLKCKGTQLIPHLAGASGKHKK